VLWNALAGRLWSRTTTYISRALAHVTGLSHAALKRLARIRYAKVAEYQARGVIHCHAVIRADAAPDPDIPDDEQRVNPPPAWLTGDLLAQAIQLAAGAVSYTLKDPDPAIVTTWGRQLDLRPIVTGRPGGPGLSAEAVAGYIAKYATKSTETLGPGLDRRLTETDLARLDRRAGVRSHVRRLAHTAWKLAEDPDLAALKLHNWAHQLGFGGHWSTRSRAYSTTMTRLRRDRADYARRQAFHGGIPLDAWGRPEDTSTVLVLREFAYAGTGWLTNAPRVLAAASAARARMYNAAPTGPAAL
jgi:hypothetical protein